MRVIRSAVEADTSASAITDPNISNLIHRHIEALADDIEFDSAVHGYFVVLEAGDTVEAINDRVGFDVLTKPVEILEDCGAFWSALYIVDDTGYGIELFISKTDANDPRLLALLEAFSNKQGNLCPDPVKTASSKTHPLTKP